MNRRMGVAWQRERKQRRGGGRNPTNSSYLGEEESMEVGTKGFAACAWSLHCRQ
jgi:hypothetical protein